MRRYSYPLAVGAIQISVINLTELSLFTNYKHSHCAVSNNTTAIQQQLRCGDRHRL